MTDTPDMRPRYTREQIERMPSGELAALVTEGGYVLVDPVPEVDVVPPARRAKNAPTMRSRGGDEAAPEVERIVVFTLDDVDYSMPNKPRPNVGIEYLRRARENAETAALYLLEEALGADAVAALAGHEDLTDADFKAVMATVQRVMLGGLEGPKA